MTQILDLKTERSGEVPIHATSLPAEPSLIGVVGIQGDEPQWDAAKRGAKPEVTVFNGSLDPKNTWTGKWGWRSTSSGINYLGVDESNLRR